MTNKPQRKSRIVIVDLEPREGDGTMSEGDAAQVVGGLTFIDVRDWLFGKPTYGGTDRAVAGVRG